MPNTPPYNPRYKEYVRQDAAHRDVAGTNIWRLKKPKTGSWRQIIDGANACCFPYTELSAEPTLDITDYTVIIECDSATYLSLRFVTDDSVGDIETLVSELNDRLGYLGTFSVSGNEVVLKLRKEIIDGMGCNTDLVLNIEQS